MFSVVIPGALVVKDLLFEFWPQSRGSMVLSQTLCLFVFCGSHEIGMQAPKADVLYLDVPQPQETESPRAAG